MEKQDRKSFILFLVSLIFPIAVASFVYGFLSHRYKIFPYRIMYEAYSNLRGIGDKPHHLFPIRYRGSGAKVIDLEATAPGLTLLTTYWRDRNWLAGVRLIDLHGNTLHHWAVDPTAIWPTSPHTDWAAGTKNVVGNYVHGSYLFPNGDLIVNIEYLGLLRMDACGRVVWKLPYRTHHSVVRDDEGNFWVSGLRWIEKDSPRIGEFPGLKPPFGEDMLVKVSPDGKILTEISVLTALYGGRYHDRLWKFEALGNDPTDLNDVEPLSRSKAAQFPIFEPGDLLISLNRINTVAVLDPAGAVKWLESDLFVQQHDPDFEDAGWISVFDNRSDGTDTGAYLGGSVISAVNPATGEVRRIYPASNGQYFFTEAGGKQQLLSNGSRLITEARAGHVLEIDKSGNTVWRWIHEPFDDELVAEVLEGTRYEIPHDVVAEWPCPPNSSMALPMELCGTAGGPGSRDPDIQRVEVEA